MKNIYISYIVYLHNIAMMAFSLVKIVLMLLYDNYCIRNNTYQH